jgi:hypothetical protein
MPYEMAAYEMATYEMAAYEMAAYEMAPVRNMPIRWLMEEICLWDGLWEMYAYERQAYHPR